MQITFGSVNATQQQQFAELLVQYGDDTETLWSEAESAFGASVVGQLQLVGQLAYLTANNAPLITALYQAEHDHPLTSAADLVKTLTTGRSRTSVKGALPIKSSRR